jgi:hypothetical protein
MKHKTIISVLVTIPIVLLFAIFAIMSMGEQKVMAAITGPCDIYASGGTPCVAAHSTVRALYGSYNGPLYQVRRASDNATKDITVLSTGGFVDTSVQDSFCSGTTCTISILYDQSSNHNDLRKAPAGATWLANGGNESSATKGKITVSGHTAYGIYVTGFSDNVAYRNNATKGIATGNGAEAMYMVVDGTRYSKDCCFDYGNAETDNKDDGNGTMEALYFGTDTAWGGQGDGNGPWIAADLENGMFKGNAGCYNCYPGPWPSAKSLNFNFVTAMLKGPAANTFGLKGGNAQSGTLTTMWNSSRPTPNYYPKSLQGAIILGTGGDGSNGGTGTFYEGCMTSGNPSDATDDAIQANIIAAGYGSSATAIPTAVPTVGPTTAPQSAFLQIEAENYSSMSGIQTETCNEGGQDVGYIENGDYIAFNSIDFGSGAASFQARVASAGSGGNIEIRLDSATGSLVGTCAVVATGDWQTYTTVTCNVSGASGIHNLYLVFIGGSGYLFNLNWFQFVPVSTCSLKGDVNGSGTIDIVDALLVAQWYVGLNPSGFNAACADVNCSGSIDIVDALLVAQYYVGLISSFPC